MANDRNIQALRVLKAMQRQDSEKASLGAATGDYNDCGPPTWNQASWDAFRAQYGFWPFGVQNGGQLLPESFAGCPDWAFERMGIRKPPVGV